MNHSYFSGCKNDDLIRFDEKQILEIKRIKQFFKQIFSGFLETSLTNHLNSLGIKIFKGTRLVDSDGKEKIHYNQWFDRGVACEVLHLDLKKWQRGKIKIRVSIEFYPDEENTEIEECLPVTNTVNYLEAVEILDADEELEALRQKLKEM